MQTKLRLSTAAIVALALCLFGATVTSAGSLAEVSLSSTNAVWQPLGNFQGYVLTISGPEGITFRSEYAGGERPSFSIFDVEGAYLPDGSYAWELRAMAELPAKASTIDRDSYVADSSHAVQSGHLRIYQGSFVIDIVREEIAATPELRPELKVDGDVASKAQVITNDLVVQGSTCTGLDCVNGESFGFDTLRLKENNLRLHFDDTSNSASFPSNDWRLIANDSANGGANKFSVEDSTAGRNPFTIEAGAPADSLYVEDGGRIGLGTKTPVVSLHVVEGNTPTLRLEQDGSNGFTPQTYDIASNEANFFIRDVTNGSKLFFRSKPGAPEDSIFIAANGDIGLGTDAPDSAMQVRRTDAATTTLHVENANAAAQASRLQVENTAAAWNIGVVSTGLLTISRAQSGQNEVQINTHSDAGGIPTLEVTGTVSATGFNPPSSRALKTNFVELDEIEILERLASIPVLEWQYKKGDAGRRHFGPMAEDFQNAFGVGDGDTLSLTDANGVSMAAIQGLNKTVKALNQQVEQLEAEKTALRGELDELRAMITALSQAQK